MLKQVLFNHMMNKETEEDKEETEVNNQTAAPGCQLSATSPDSLDGLSPATEENQASASLQKDASQLSAGTPLSDTNEHNGEVNLDLLY